MAARPSTGHWYSQIPQPMQRVAPTTGRLSGSRPPAGAATLPPPTVVIAFLGSGHISWQTMQGVLRAQGRQRSRSTTAKPITDACFAGSAGLGMAPEGQVWPQALQS